MANFLSGHQTVACSDTWIEKAMSSKFIKLIVKILLIMITVTMASTIIIRIYQCDAPVISNNISFDAKLIDFEKHHIQKVELLSIGSSMTLNNLNSKVIRECCNKSYYNLGSWGLQISDIRYLLGYFIPRTKPKYIMICSSVTDFRQKDAIQLPTYTELLISDYFMGYFYFKNPSRKLLLARKAELDNSRIDNNQYFSLLFDDYGGVTLNIPRKNILPNRWNKKLELPTKFTDYQYKELGTLAKSLGSDNIKLFYIQPPIKQSLLNNGNNNGIVQNHFDKCKVIVESNGGIYYNLHDPRVYDDSLFVDQYHLSEAGSIVFTRQLMNLLKPILCERYKVGRKEDQPLAQNPDCAIL